MASVRISNLGSASVTVTLADRSQTIPSGYSIIVDSTRFTSGLIAAINSGALTTNLPVGTPLPPVYTPPVVGGGGSAGMLVTATIPETTVPGILNGNNERIIYLESTDPAFATLTTADVVCLHIASGAAQLPFGILVKSPPRIVGSSLIQLPVVNLTGNSVDIPSTAVVLSVTSPAA